MSDQKYAVEMLRRRVAELEERLEAVEKRTAPVEQVPEGSEVIGAVVMVSYCGKTEARYVPSKRTE